MATATAVRKGFDLRCPACGEADTMRLDLADVNTLSCSSCDETFDHENIRVIVSTWTKLLAWVTTAPRRDD
jgi:uncharacterized protein (DUF983 family)